MLALIQNNPLGARFKRQASDGERGEERKECADTTNSTPLKNTSPLNQLCAGFVVCSFACRINNLFLSGTKKAGVDSTSLKVSSLTPRKVKTAVFEKNRKNRGNDG